MKPAQIAAVAKRAAEGVARRTGVPAEMCHPPILWALQDAQAEAEYQAGERFMRWYWRGLAALVAVGALATWWAA